MIINNCNIFVIIYASFAPWSIYYKYMYWILMMRYVQHNHHGLYYKFNDIKYILLWLPLLDNVLKNFHKHTRRKICGLESFFLSKDCHATLPLFSFVWNLKRHSEVIRYFSLLIMGFKLLMSNPNHKLRTLVKYHIVKIVIHFQITLWKIAKVFSFQNMTHIWNILFNIKTPIKHFV